MSRESALAMVPAPSPTPAPTANSGSPGLQAVPQPGAETAKPELDSTRFNHLAKKESEIVKQREAIKIEREAFAREKAEVASEREKMRAINKQLQDFEAMKVKDPVAALKLAGFSETDLMNFIAQAEAEATPEQKAQAAAKAEIDKFKSEQEKVAKEAQGKAEAQALDTFKKSITSTITADKDKYEYCNHYGAVAEDLILETVTAVLEESKGTELISAQEAADMVEAFYEEQDKAMSTLKKRSPKVEAAIQAMVEPEKPLRPEVSPRPQSQGQALSSKAKPTVGSTTVPRKETPAQKRERLIQKLSNLGK